MSIQSGDNPNLVRIKLETYFRDAALAPVDELHQMDEPRQVSVLHGCGSRHVDELAQRVGETSLMQMSDEQWAMLYMDMACIARGDGILALEPLLEVIDDGVLHAGMRASLVDQSPPDEVQRAMESNLQLQRLALKRLEAMVLTGMADIQAGRKPQEIVEAARAAAEEQGAQLLAAGYPRP